MTKIGAVLFLVLIWQAVSVCQQEEGRAFWVVRDALVSEEKIKTMVDRVAESRCNMMFVQVCGRGEAYYQSDLLPRAEALPDSQPAFDPLQTVIDLAHQRGVQVHAWVNTFFVWSAAEEPLDHLHVIHVHPEWIEQTLEGRPLSAYERPRPYGTEGVYLSPGLPAVAAWISGITGEIVDRYRVDGIHLDYARYPHERTGFHPAAVQRFQRQYHFDPASLYTEAGDGDSGKVDEGMDSLKQVWIQWRCEQVTETIRMIRDRTGLRSPRVQLSAAVKPDYGRAVEAYGQDWKRWMELGLLDFVVVMAYSPSTDEVVQQVREARQLLKGRSFFAGIGIYNQPASTTVEQIEAVRSIGVDGLALFSYNSVAENDEYLRTLKENCFGRSSLSGAKNPKSKD